MIEWYWSGCGPGLGFPVGELWPWILGVSKVPNAQIYEVRIM